MVKAQFFHRVTSVAVYCKEMKKPLTSLPKLMLTPVKAGFPNPAEDARSVGLDLNELVIRHPVATYYLRVDGDSMTGAGITSGDIVVVDKSLEPKNSDIVVAAVDGEFTLKYLKRDGQKAWLVAAHPGYPPIALHEAADATLWGVVTYVIHRTRQA
jgi:DNA polymerase V